MYPKLPRSVEFEHSSPSPARALGTMLRTNTVAKTTTVAMFFIGVSNVFLEEMILRTCSPSADTGVIGRQKRPCYLIYSLSSGRIHFCLSAHPPRKSRVC